MRNAWMQRTISQWRDPINVNRYVIWLLLSTILVGGGPDVIVMLAYGEVSNETTGLILQFDRIMDGLTMFPVVAAILLWYRAKPVINYQLIRQPIPVDLWPKLRKMGPNIRIGGVVALIALGVALGK
jgi:hypothetical protein